MDIERVLRVIGVVSQIVRTLTPAAQELRSALADEGIAEADLDALLERIKETARKEIEATS